MKVKTAIKRHGLRAIRVAGVNQLFRAATQRNLLVLCYHAVAPKLDAVDPFHDTMVVGLREFKRQLDIVLEFFRPLSPQDLLRTLDGEPLPKNSVLITFDDGYRNNLTWAAPELERRGVPALFFVTSGLVGGSEFLWPQELAETVVHWTARYLPLPCGEPPRELPGGRSARLRIAGELIELGRRIADRERTAYLNQLRSGRPPLKSESQRKLFGLMNWEEVIELRGRGFDIGSHTVDHPVLTRLEPAELDHQLQESKAVIERRLGVECPWIAYPHGGPKEHSRQVRQAAQRAGYRAGFALCDRLNPKVLRPLAIQRICMVGRAPIDSFRARISGVASLWQSQ